MDYRTLPLYGIDETTKNQEQRSVIIQQWKCSGGILVMGYETFRRRFFNWIKTSVRLCVLGSQKFGGKIGLISKLRDVKIIFFFRKLLEKNRP